MWKWVGDVSWKLFESVKISTGAFYFARNRCDNMNEAERPRSAYQTDSKDLKGWHQLDTDAQPYFCWKEDYIFDCHLSSAARGCFTSKQKLLVFVCMCVFRVATQNISKLRAANVHLISSWPPEGVGQCPGGLLIPCSVSQVAKGSGKLDGCKPIALESLGWILTKIETPQWPLF